MLPPRVGYAGCMDEAQLRADFAAWADRSALIEALDDEALALSLFTGLGSDALPWLDREIPALDGRTPRSCLRSKAGQRALRALIAKLPR